MACKCEDFIHIDLDLLPHVHDANLKADFDI